jgi:hypothetical protein
MPPTYAPHLDIVGTAEGGIPVDLFHNLAYINHPDSGWTGQIPAYLGGLDIRDLDKYFTPRGIAAGDPIRPNVTVLSLVSRPSSCSSRSTRTSKRYRFSSASSTNSS